VKDEELLKRKIPVDRLYTVQERGLKDYLDVSISLLKPHHLQESHGDSPEALPAKYDKLT
jgi:hypothetical protein